MGVKMTKIIKILLLALPTFIYSECSDLDYDLCVYYSQYCEWG